MTITIKMLAAMYGVCDTFRQIVNTHPNWPLVRWSYSVEDGQAFIELIGRG
jgi:hypothetical protein|nr:MAG TPA: hypothetical protein [Caudoviricetes sp.]